MSKTSTQATLMRRIRSQVTFERGDRVWIEDDTLWIRYAWGDRPTYDIGPIEFIENVLAAELPAGWRLHYGAEWMVTESAGDPDPWIDTRSVELYEDMSTAEIQKEIDDTIDDYEWHKALFWIGCPEGWDFLHLDWDADGYFITFLNEETDESVDVRVSKDMTLLQMQIAADATFDGLD
jgi:hypothetical protein